jgi:hypothetical protein
MGRHGADPAIRVQRAASHLKASANYLEAVADDEGIPMPVEVVRAVITIRQWTRTLGARDPDPPVEPGPLAARPRLRQPWRPIKR